MVDSIVSEITPHTLATEIRMQRSASGNSILVVEGNDDAKFYRRFTNVHVCTIVVAHGRERALGVLGILEGEEFPGILCLLDADFGRLLGHTQHPNIVVTDTHDVESMLVRSKALDAVLDEFGSTPKIESFEAANGQSVRDCLVHRVAEIGCLRFLSQTNEWYLYFDGLDYDFINRQTLKTNLESLINKVLARSNFVSVPRSDVKAMVENELHNNHSQWDMCNGHDLIAILDRGFRRALGSCGGNEVSTRQIGTVLRMALDYEDFKEFNIYRGIRAWELNNPPYLICK